jgi:hypothetical protein
MPQINLTPQETVLLYGFLCGVTEVVAEKSDLELLDKENTTNLLISIMGKVETEINNQTTEKICQQLKCM